MRVLMICTVKFDISGIPIHIINYANKLCEFNGMKIDIISSEFVDDAIKKLNTQKINLIEIERNRNPLMYMKKLRTCIKKNKYDIVHIHGNSSTMSIELFACSLINVKKIVHAHNIRCTHNIINVVFKPFLIGLSDMKFACSTEAGKWLYGSKFDVINNGIYNERYKYCEYSRKLIREQYNIDDSIILLGNIGTFNYQKNHEFLIDIALNLPSDKYKFMLIGGGEKDNFVSCIERAGVSKQFIILDADIDIQKYYSAFDIFLLPSRWEGLGMVIVEAQYASLKSIITNTLPQEVEVSELLKRVSLNSELWAKEIEKLSIDNNDRNLNYIVNHKYEIEHCTEYLLQKYKEILA